MSTGRLSKNNALAGLFVIACIALFVLVIVLLTGAQERIGGKSAYVIEFALSDGADGLERGSVVKLAGKRVGRVTKSDFLFDPADPRTVKGIAVDIEVRSDIQLFEDADVNLVRPLLGTNSAINISSLKTSPDARPVNPGAHIKGKLGPPGFLTQADYARVQNVLQRVEKWSAEIDPQVKPIAEDVRQTVAHFKEISGKANASWDKWSADVDAVLADAKKASGQIEGMVTSAKDGVQEVRNVFAKVDDFLVRNRPVIDGFLDDARELARKAKGEGYDKVIALLDNAQETMQHASNVAKDVDELVTAKTPELSDIVTNASLAAQELKLATQEIRAAPWRLLYQPNKKELENELLYNSIRRYSRTLADLKTTANALDAVTKQLAAQPPGQVGAISSAEVAVLAAKLRDSISQSEEQERLFFERWIRSDDTNKKK